ncbi:hypothetical protein CK503_05940, partial [Aliifodinibius salipaludis]
MLRIEVRIINLRRLLDVRLLLGVEAGVGDRGAAGEQGNAENDSEKFVRERFHNNRGSFRILKREYVL